ncbi:MAG: OmpA family protein [Allorhizobium sp.]
MKLRSKLFATVAVPVLSAAVMIEPAAAATVVRPTEAANHSTSTAPAGLLLAQALVTCSDGSQAADQLACDAIIAKRAAEQQAAEEAQRAAEQQAAEEAQRAAEQQAAEEAQRAAEQQAAEEAQRAAEQQAAEEAQRAAEQQAAEEAQRAAEQQAAEEAQRAAEQQAAEEAQRAAEQQAAEEAQRAAEQQAAEEAQRAAEQQAAEEAQKASQPQAEQPAPEVVTCADGSQAASADACPVPAPAPAPAEETPVDQVPAQAPALEAPAEPAPTDQVPADQAPAEQAPSDAAPQDEVPAQPAPGEQLPTESPQTDGAVLPSQDGTQGETPAQPLDQSTAQPAVETAPDAQPTGEQVVVPAVEPPVEAPVLEIIDTRTEEQKLEIAEDPSKTAETVVLPVDNGAAVLDSDKDADNTGIADVRDSRTLLRAAETVAPPPATDAEAQAAAPVIEAQVLQAAALETGTQLEAAPTFEVPTTIVNNATYVTNNVTNNTVIQSNVVNQVTEVRVIEQVDSRTIINVGNQIVVRGDDRERLRYDAEEAYYEELSRGRVRETIIRPDGSRTVTIYNRFGDIIQRSRITPYGDEYVLLYSPEADMEMPHVYVDVGYDLPPMRLTIPVEDYIVTTSYAPDRDYYDFLAQPPVERVERIYSMDEVKSSARLRDKVRRIDLDTITFPSGSAEVPLAQAKTLRKVAEAMERILAKDPGETFLIEGHTDAVGSDRSNLILSDQRAEAVANLLTEVYGIPPENLSVQGYGERYLKIRTAGDEQQNRRVAIRRVTSLVRPESAANR